MAPFSTRRGGIDDEIVACIRISQKFNNIDFNLTLETILVGHKSKNSLPECSSSQPYLTTSRLLHSNKTIVSEKMTIYFSGEPILVENPLCA